MGETLGITEVASFWKFKVVQVISNKVSITIYVCKSKL